MKTKNIICLFLIISQWVFAQPEGYWDKDRATTKEIKLGAGDRIVIRTEDFPTGTTEVVFRITLLDDNQQMANSLVSVLKSIPDPTGISQGSAGAVFLMSKVSGDDKCTYAVFSSEKNASAYVKEGKTDKSCWKQSDPLSKDAKRLSIDKSSCFGSDAMWFGFESKNWLMKAKIVLEVVPWVDRNLNRGWTVENRKNILAISKTSDIAELMLSPDDYCVCILEKMQKKYTYDQYSKLLAVEKTKVFKDLGNSCLSKSEDNLSIQSNIRNDAAKHFKNRKYNEAIRLLQAGIIDRGTAKALDYNAIGQYYLYSKQYEKAIKAFKEGEKLDNSELLIKLNLAHAYLLNNDFQAAKALHKKYMMQNVTASLSWKEKATADFNDFRSAKIDSGDFERILKLFQ
ncbi:tetratricopeptide repeat protein [Flavobacterium pallidum]|uniref:Uncharacterized protein n=1 Tax=Flavobacterium pallidum TaxID=2172098 RepID=A0A2S1SJE5_9FLAO|nr:hypothetical protein [Flavobacterium pallidum]AWI26543.1 hypothetical protein HYN49_11890 [Flavobacterium pallidum]